MATQFEIDCALMAGSAYRSNRPDINQFPIPMSDGWVEVAGSYFNDRASGFEAVSFTNGNEIVISFAGTDSGSFSDLLADAALAFGFGSAQLKQAAEYYLQVKAANPDAHISFTGHSLGGGLAALMGVFFNETAVTFDQAPFALSATVSIRDELIKYLKNTAHFSDADLAALAPGLLGFTGLTGREGNVIGINVQGEFLSVQDLFSRIGAQTLLEQGAPDLTLMMDLHSQSLLTAFVGNPTFEDLTFKMPDLVRMIFDKKLYAYDTGKSNTRFENFLERLVRHEFGNAPGVAVSDNMLSRFTADLWKIAQDGGLTLTNNDISKTLIAFAMQMYYENANATDINKLLFTNLTGGLRFDRNDVADTLAASKGYTLYFSNYLAGLPWVERGIISRQLPNLPDWYIQAGAQAMTAVAADQRAFMLGGIGDDDLTGSSQADVLDGNQGADTLTGGGGNDSLIGGLGDDMLNGGDGYDTYLIEGHDTLIDTDGLGRIQDKAGDFISGVIEEHSDGTYVFLSDPAISVTRDTNLTLTLADGTSVVIDNFQDGNLGLYVSVDVPPPPVTLAGTADDNYLSIYQSGAGAVLGGAGRDMIFGSLQADELNGGDGGDWIVGGGEADHIIAGAGDDMVSGIGGGSYVEAGDGNDIVVGATAEFMAISYPSGSIAADVFWGDLIQYWNNSASANFSLDATGHLTGVAGGGVPPDFNVSGPSKLGNGWTYRFSIDSSGTFNATYYHPTLAQDGIRPAGVWQHGLFATAPQSRGIIVDGGDGNDFLGGYDRADYLAGGTGDDMLLGNGGDDTLDGGAGNDNLAGGDGDDVLIGADGIDALYGEGGSDHLAGGVGDDTLWGDSASSLLSAQDGNDYLDGGDGNDQLVGQGGADTLTGGDGNDTLYGEAADTPIAMQGNDYLDGGAGDDLLLGAGGADVLLGGAGSDQLYGDSADTPDSVQGDDYLDGADGADILVGGGGADTLLGGTGDDRLFGDADDTDSGIQGADYLDGGDGNDLLVGYGGADTLIGGDGADELQGGDGNDLLDAGIGDDRLFGGNGDDVLLGGAGDDAVIGGAGDDVLYGDDGNDDVQGGDGLDVLSGGAGDDLLYGENGDDTLVGDDGIDQLQGGDGSDALFGGAGADALFGGNGDDTLDGGSGDDIIIGGDGNDVLSGGGGVDWYVLDAGFGEDHIADTGANGVQFNFSFDGAGIILGLGSLKISFANQPGGVLHIDGFDPNDPLGTCPITTFSFDDRTLSLQQLLDIGMDLTGTPYEDFISGTALNERINALEGNDIVYAGGGNDTVDGGTGNDALYGDAGSDTLAGNAGNDLLDGGGGVDTLIGGTGDDIYVVDSAADTIVENDGEGADTVVSGVGYSLGAALENLALTGAADLYAFGNGGDNAIAGNSGDNLIDGGTGADTMAGCAGSDTYYVDNAADTVIENPDEGVDTVYSTVDRVLGDNIETLTLTGCGNINGTGNALDNVITGTDAVNTLAGAAGNDKLYGLAGDDMLDGGAGADMMDGGYGNDTYLVDNAGDTVIEEFVGTQYAVYPGYGGVIYYTLPDYDTVNSSISYTLPRNVEYLTLTGSGDINGAGNALDNIVIGNGGANVLTGNDGGDQLYGGVGNDTLYGGNGGDTLDGGAGADTMAGGADADIYFVDTAADVVAEYAGGGTDTVCSAVSYALSNNVENLTLTGDGDINGFGNALGNILTGNDGVNVLTGGAGSDLYVVQTIGDTVIESAEAGAWDVVISSVDFALGDNVEELDLTDSAVSGIGNIQNNTIYGTASGNILNGAAGDDFLDGGAGNDNLYGGDGDDWLFGGGEVFSEGGLPLSNRDTLDGGAGNDYIDGASGDDAIFGGSGDDTIYGGRDDSEIGQLFTNNDTIDGGDGNDTIDGGTGADKLYGGAGDDWLYGGTNSQYDSIYDYTIRDYVTLSENDLLDGGAGNDILDGGVGNDKLIGGAGSDTMSGGAGDDVYAVDGSYVKVDGSYAMVNDCGETVTVTGEHLEWTTDSVIDDAGYDTVLSSASYIMADGVERLKLIHDPALAPTDPQQEADLQAFGQDGVGNALDNVIIGNDLINHLEGGVGADLLEGGAGNDTLVGGADDDVLRGGSGDDRYVFRSGDGADHIEDDQGNDTLYFGSDLTVADLRATALNGDLVLNIIGTADSVTLADWFGQTDGLSRIEFCDGSSLDKDGILSLLPAPPPLLMRPLADLVTLEDDCFTYRIPADAFSGSDLSYTAGLADGAALPEWLGFDAATRTFGGTPDNWDVGSLNLAVTAVDAWGQATRTAFALTVLNVNDAPTMLKTVNDQSATEGLPFSIAISAGQDSEFLNSPTAGGTPIGGGVRLIGTSGNDTLVGGAGDDALLGGGGGDLLSGGGGADSLHADTDYTDRANDMLMGGAGSDYLDSSLGNDLVIGGAGDDEIYGDDGNDVILFNRGDGKDWYGSNWSSTGVPLAQRIDAVSLGGGIVYADLAFVRDAGSDLILYTGNGESITFGGWFDGSSQDNKAIATLQVVAAAMPGYDPQSPDPLLNRRIQQFDFAGLAERFTAAFADDPTIVAWALAPYLADYSLGGLDSAAIGGDMAYLYGKEGELNRMSEEELRTQLDDSDFGVRNQALTKLGGVSGLFSDADFIHGDGLTFSVTLADGSALPAWLSFDAGAGTFSGTPGHGDVGMLNVMMTATDSRGLSASTTFKLDVARIGPANYPPAAHDDTLATDEDTAHTAIATMTLLANDDDPDAGDVLTLSAYDTVSAQGNMVLRDAGGNLVLEIGDRYQSLGEGQTAYDSFAYTVSDAAGAASSAIVNVIIAGVNDAPVVQEDAVAVSEDTALAITGAVLGNDFDVDEGTVLAVSDAGMRTGVYGTLLLASDGSYSYTLNNGGSAVQSLAAGQVASERFDYQASDGEANTASRLIVTIAGANDVPFVLNPIPDQAAMAGRAFGYQVPATAFSDVDSGDVLAYSAALAGGQVIPSWLTFDGMTRTFSGAPASGDVGQFSIDVAVTDRLGARASDTFLLNVAPSTIAGGAGCDDLTGTECDDDIEGYEGNDVLRGRGGNDHLAGGTGADTMYGGKGDDTYFVDNACDVVTENAGEGVDTVQSSITYALGANVENLVLTGTAAIKGTGNALNNVLRGSSAANTLSGGAGSDTLDGGAGADQMKGGAGNDFYVVDNGADAIVENANEGTDTVQSSITFTLAANVENLILTGAKSVGGTGNALNNVLTGNSAANTLTGEAGNDILDGGAANDSLVGGAGNDVYVFGRGYGVDTVTEKDSTAGNSDLASFGAGIAAGQLWFRHVGNNLDVSILGTADHLVMKDWYLGSQYHVERFQTADGKLLTDSHVENLINAMAAFSAPPAGQSVLPPEYEAALVPAITANWQ